MILLIISFLAGVLTILAPCTLPLLPVIIGSSVTDDRSQGIDSVGPDGQAVKASRSFRKPLTIASSLGLSVILFTLLLKFSTIAIGIPQGAWQIVSGAIILVFGLVSLFPTIWEKIPLIRKLNVGSNRALAVGYKRGGFWGDVIIGASLGPVFSTCSPTYFVILATVLPQSFILGLIDLFAYAIGLGGVLLLVAYLGQKLVSRIGGLSDSRGWFKRGLGILFIIIGILVIFGVDKKLETKLLSSGLGDITRVEQKLLQLNDSSADQNSNQDQGADSNASSGISIADMQSGGSCGGGKCSPSWTSPYAGKRYPNSAEITNPSGFVNTGGQPITIGEFKGKKVVLLDIWTYSCINCQRTIPYLRMWDEKYRDAGLEIIGIHTPEFAFEKIQANVEKAVKGFGIRYPVVLDNAFSTWNAFGNNYWPRKYLINADGKIVFDHIGEGEYEAFEREIQKALVDLKMKTGSNVVIPMTISKPGDAISMQEGKVRSPEVYFGSARNQYLENGTAGKNGDQDLGISAAAFANPKSNALYLEGTWNFTGEYATTKSQSGSGPSTGSKILFRYDAKNVYMVASSPLPAGTMITIKKDGMVVKTITIKDEKLYTLIEGDSYGEHVMEIDIPDVGFEAFTFTFG
jgi:cytochrome c biogenesis protein CcdA/thiol-disulfide isomerase/thioredoxin